jgi:hypothetical protein
MPGIAITGSAVVGAAYALLSGLKTRRTRTYWAALAGLVAAAWIFHVLVPAGVESRKLVVALPALFVLAGEGAVGLGRWMAPHRQRPMTGVLFISLALLTTVLSLPIAAKPKFGFQPVAAALDGMLPPGSAALLVTDWDGEGSVIADFALRHPKPAVYLLRGTRLLATQEWNGRSYRLRVHTTDECARLLASVPVDVLVLDRRKSAHPEPHCSLVEDMLKSDSSGWVLTEEFQTPSDSTHAVAIYTRSTGIEPLRQLPRWVVPPIRLPNLVTP